MSGVVQHVVNKHTWTSGRGVGVTGCLHEPVDTVDPDKPWLKNDSPAHKALQKILFEGNWLKNAGEKYKNFRYKIPLDF